jgi:outer membrane protein OmpA-like peptidoglycan-associated protein/tetratricopeptide (TPR) repeat protein
MNRAILILAISFISSQFFWAQENPRIDKETFFAGPGGMEEVKSDLKKAEKYYKKGQGTYDEALKYYRKAYRYNPNSLELNYKIGICYLLSSDKAASLKYFLESNPEVAKDYYLVLGRAYQYNMQFTSAKESYEKYLNTLNTLQRNDQRKKIKQLISECDYGASLTKDSLDVFIINLGPVINSYYDDYNAFLPPMDSNIYFTTKRPLEEPKKRVSRFEFKEQIYMANNCLKSTCEWAVPLKDLNLKSNVSMAGVDKNAHRMFFYDGKWQNGQLMITSYDKKKNKWKKIRSVKGKINHIAYNETSISIGPDNTAYFISDRRGGMGGKDIWVAPHKRNDRWGKPRNIGMHLNTPFDEESVYISDDGNTLYFSSKGHLGMGGFDVYRSERQPDNSWGNPINMGYPINSPADELFYHPTPDTMIALYATIRADSYGGLDIYKIQKDPRKPFSIKGSVKDVESNDLLNATINIIDNNTKLALASIATDPLTKEFFYNFEDTGNYSLQISQTGYKSIMDSLECPDLKRDTLELSYALELIKHPFTLSGKIVDVDSRKPISAYLVFKDALSDTVYGRQYTDSLGNYSITFEDKFNMKVLANAENYYATEEQLDASKEKSGEIIKNIELKTSKIIYTITGAILDESNNDRLYGILSFYIPGKENPIAIESSDSIHGKFTVQLEEKGPFLVEVAADEYFFINDVVSFPENETVIAKNFMLKKMSTGAKIVVENILFNTGKSTLKPESFKELDKLAIMLIRNPNVRIEVSGHTDNVGSASVNKRLSKSRALTVKNYLVSRGVESERMEYEGYGFDKPIAPNNTPEGRAQNRRVEIEVIN